MPNPRSNGQKSPNLQLVGKFTVTNELGLHARPAVEFVNAVRASRCAAFIVRDHKRFNARSIMDVLLANLDCGSDFTLEVEGPDARELLDKIVRLLPKLK